jgi:hypothetical protein
MFGFFRACKITFICCRPRGGRCIETESSLCQMNVMQSAERSGGLPAGSVSSGCNLIQAAIEN